MSTFGPFQVYLFQIIRVWQGRNPGDTLSKYLVILEAGYPALEMVFSDPDLVKSGFRQSGLFPWNPSAIDTRKLEPSKVSDEDSLPTLELPSQERGDTQERRVSQEERESQEQRDPQEQGDT